MPDCNPIATAETEREGRLRGQRILVVDDIEINRIIFRRQLEAEDAEIREAEDGPSALCKVVLADAQGEPYHTILLDHMMPGMTGETVAAKIKANGSLAQPRIVLASSIGMLLNAESRAVLNAVLTKPVREAS